MTYEELLALPASWSARTDATASAPAFIAMAEGEMQVLRTRQMVVRADLSITGETEACPTDFLDQRSLTTGEFEIDYVTPERLDQIVSDDYLLTDRGDGPAYYTVVGSEFRFWPIPVATYTAELTYYAQPAPVTETVSNWILDGFPNVYTFGVLWACAMWRKDNDDIALYRGNLDRALGVLQSRFADRTGKALRADRSFLQRARRVRRWR